MRKSTKVGLIAGVLALTGAVTLVFSTGAGREPLGTMALMLGTVAASAALRLRFAAN